MSPVDRRCDKMAPHAKESRPMNLDEHRSIGRTPGAQCAVRALSLLAASICLLLGSQLLAQAQSKLITEYTMDGLSVEVPFVYSQHQIVLHGEAGGKKDLTFL